MSRYDSRPWRHLYKTAEWQRLRQSHMQAEPVCRYCKQLGQVTAVEVVDHITPHKGDEHLFFDPSNLQSLCKTCHDSVKQAQEKSGVLRGHSTDGSPLDPAHHWNK